ncbi:delta-1-pyrroline-5-carboxylate dehydrogenase [Punctularia strigosozonata HHB-11173 SS5]|uniref:delta-1-pyrroline-5-carboxylate dehydrogenase n=1 Tax=Punctularia strigosozonata (strain HHB-11173) TaxID=741275 RepID=UPI0004417B33|nr:delta-1-pyrroline-5-carboxylate dehydrogenase [Punctularia strigosozonata HHB-11173 SS5]EIN11051.1 delta-1-pyrroline-5-carboxylate dehydrogenase [Punctularia strigosozonata HHB-11173 SS5]
MSVPQLASFKVPEVANEPMKSYAPGAPERKALEQALADLQKELPVEVPCVVNGKPVRTGKLAKQTLPGDHAKHLCTYHEADQATVAAAIDGALAAKAQWESLPWNDRAAIFLKAADLVSGKYRYKLLAATMLGQGKNAWQAEIDAAAEMADFFRFGVKYVEELYSQQPPKNSSGSWNRVEYRALEGFVLAVSPFNFTAIGGNLSGAPALVGNVVVWKPSPMATYANYITHQILTEAGVPPGVIQFVPGPAEEVVGQCIDNPSFAGLHFTGSTFVFKKLWKDIAQNLDKYKGYPRIVGETGGKNFHLVHSSAEIKNTVVQTIRGAFEYQGQKCSALSRLYVPTSLWENGFKDTLLAETAKIKVGPVTDFQNYLGPVIGRPAFDKITSYIQKAKDAGGEILIGGSADDSTGFFVQPTIIQTKDPKSVTMTEEIFGPVLTVYVYPDAEYEATAALIDSTSPYGLTGAIFATDRSALLLATNKLRNAAGNMYYNEKCTGAVVGQQPFGGGRASGTNDKAGSVSIFYRFVSARSIKENFVGLEEYLYPSNFV